MDVGTNSWLSEADADTYFSTRFGASTYWCSGAEKEAALVTAYHQLNDSGLYSFPAYSSASSAQLAMMQRAQCEQALFIIQHQEDLDSRKGLQAQGVIEAGIIKEKFAESQLTEIPICAQARAALTSFESRKPIFAIDLERDEDEDVK